MSTLNADFGRLYKGPTRATYSVPIVHSTRKCAARRHALLRPRVTRSLPRAQAPRRRNSMRYEYRRGLK